MFVLLPNKVLILCFLGFYARARESHKEKKKDFSDFA